MDDTASAAAPACADFQRDIPLHALGALGGLDAEDAARLEAHVRGCEACRGLLEVHRQVLETVRRESSPSVLLNTDRVLQVLRRRMAEESRVAYAPEAALSKRGRVLWVVSLAALAVAVCVIAVIFLGPASTERPPANGGGGVAEALAWRYEPGASAGAPVRPGQEISAAQSGVRLHYSHGVDVRLRQEARLRCATPSLLVLQDGTLALQVPHDGRPFLVQAEANGVLARGQPGSRFTVSLQGSGGSARVELAVAEGRVEWAGPGGEQVVVEAGQLSRCAADGRPSAPALLDSQAAFAWVLERTYRSLKCEFRADSAPDLRLRGTLALLNAGEHPVKVANYYPLGVNYFLEIRGAGERGSKSVKLSPRALRRRLADGRTETFQPAKMDVLLEPGERYELELDLQPLLDGAGPVVLAADYLGFETDGPNANEPGAWGFTLRSEEVSFTPPERSKNKGPEHTDKVP